MAENDDPNDQPFSENCVGLAKSNPDLSLPASGKLTEIDHDSKTMIGGVPEPTGVSRQVLVGENVGKYLIRGLLGEGGMGAVYLAFDPLIEREVALKVLAEGVGNSEVALQRFLGEARAIGRMNHPNVVSIYDIDQWNSHYYLVMELLSGGSVASLVEKDDGLPWQQACDLIAQAASGLAAAHAAGMIHRDIKPENLMLTKEGIVKVVDFGLSKLLDAANDTRSAVTKVGQILGTPQYMSPEQFEAIQVDARTDIYSLGATLFRLLTSRFPFHDCRTIVQVMTAHLTKPPPIAKEFKSDVPSECDRIIAKSMAKNREDRYQSAADLAADLKQLLATQTRITASSPVESAVVERDLTNVV
ncbi:MAG: serine/threonine protein kinase, partial [Planctomycetes bacterium]|nr:serine/threonine protein kinase [Planctomycetota bacterium]